MKITLISVYPDLRSYGIRSISACLKQEGHDVDLFFLTREFIERFENKTMDDLVKLTKGSDLIGISLMSNFWDNAVQITTKLKEHYETPILWGGTHATIRPEECLEHADMVCIGEGEEALVELTRKMQKGEYYYDVKGMGFKTNEKKVKQLVSFLEKNHSYDCPCIIASPIKKNNKNCLLYTSDAADE